MSFADLGQIPYKHLPTEVLLAMREQLRKELGRRGLTGPEDSPRPGGRGNGGGWLGRQAPRLKEQQGFKQRWPEFDALMAEDWSALFAGGSDERRFYVYAHVNPRGSKVKNGGDFALCFNGRPFYIGKGTGRRAWELNRNEGHGVELRQLRDAGVADSEIVHIIRDNLTEREALEIESKLIYFFGTKFEPGRKGILVNLDFPARPRRETDTRDAPKLAEFARKAGIEATA